MKTVHQATNHLQIDRFAFSHQQQKLKTNKLSPIFWHKHPRFCLRSLCLEITPPLPTWSSALHYTLGKKKQRKSGKKREEKLLFSLFVCCIEEFLPSAAWCDMPTRTSGEACIWSCTWNKRQWDLNTQLTLKSTCLDVCYMHCTVSSKRVTQRE